MSFPRDAYPYTNFHELNLGYFIVHFREIFSQWADLYNQMLNWKEATDEELATWKAGVEADLDQRETVLRAELETWKAQTGQDIAGWEDATLAALTAWQTATQAVFEAIRVEAAGSASAAAASAGDATTAKTAAETAQAAAEAAAASVQASAAQITTNTEDIADLKTQLNDLADDQIITLFNESVSGTRLVTIPKVIPAGTYHLKIDSVTSDDTAHSTSRITFWNGNTQLAYKDVNRQNGFDGTITLNSDTTAISFYGYYNYDNSAGISFTFNNVVVTKNTVLNERLSTLEADVDRMDSEITDFNSSSILRDNFITDKQRKLKYNNTVTGVRNVNIPLVLNAGSYYLHIDSITSTDSSHTTSRITFWNGSTDLKHFDVNRETGYDGIFTLNDDTTAVSLYGYTNYSNSEGIDFTFNNIVLGENTILNERLTNLEVNQTGIEKNATDIENIYDYQAHVFLNESVSGTGSAVKRVSMPAGEYHLTIDSVDSADETYTSSRMLFFAQSDGSIAYAVDINRESGRDSTFTLDVDVQSIGFYAAHNATDSSGKAFSFNNVFITNITGLTKALSDKVSRNVVEKCLIRDIINPYHNVVFSDALKVKTTTHSHVTNQTGLDNLMSKNLTALAISNYYPSNPTYTIQECLNTPRPEGLFPLNPDLFTGTIPEVLEIPNTESHNMTNVNWHITTPGSMFYSGKNSPSATPKGINDSWQHAIIKIKNKLLYKDGGGTIINHPTQYPLQELYDALDYDETVLGIEIFNDTDAHWPAEGHDYETTGDNPIGWNVTKWDNILKTGRRCWCFAVPDHYNENHANWRGSITIFVDEITQEKVLKAIRDGAFYAQLNHTGLTITDYVYSGNTVSITVNETATIKCVIDGNEFTTITGTTANITIPESATYVRFEISTNEDTIYTNPLMLRKRSSAVFS